VTTARVLAAAAALLAAAPAAAAARPGDLDRRFGSGGVATTRLLDGAFAATLQRDGRILVAGGISKPGVMRLMPGGRRDRTFGRAGVAATDRYGLPFGVRRGRDGEVRVGLATTTTNRPPVEILRFGGDGTVLPPAIHTEHAPGPLETGLLRPDGGAYVSSYAGIRAVAPDGSLDTAFAGGTLERGELPGWRAFWLLTVRPDGRVLLGARRSAGGTFVLQLTPDGRLDPTFGEGGATRVPFAALVRVVRGGELVGVAARGRYAARVFRLTASGRRRRAFGVRGVAGWWRRDGYGYVADVVQDARGRIYVLSASSGKRVRVLALTRGGRALRRFGRRGAAALPRPRRGRTIEPADLLLAGRRGLLVVGTRYRGPAYHPGRDACEDIREDFCSWEQSAAVWRLRR
jgi:antitoxin (DNA-binding transcriptional repressor) of toxin-antitoxin stability system